MLIQPNYCLLERPNSYRVGKILERCSHPQIQDYWSENILDAEGEVVLYQQLFSAEDSDRFLQELREEISWRQEEITLFGRLVKIPRLTAWHGDTDRIYTYSGIKMQPKPWIHSLRKIKYGIESVTRVHFNSVLLNLYRDGQDSVAWHSDDEPELGVNPVIASVSFGATRQFSLKHKTRKDLSPVKVSLTHGSLLVMKGETQKNWLHQVPKTKKPVGHRINLTFRVIL